MAGYLLDTNHMSEAVKPVSRVRDRIAQARRRGIRCGTCFPVLCEIEAGIQDVHQPERYRRSLMRLLDLLSIWPMEPSVATTYGELHSKMRRQGRVLSTVDLMLAALALHDGRTLLTADRDFEAIPEVKTENWLVQP